MVTAYDMNQLNMSDFAWRLEVVLVVTRACRKCRKLGRRRRGRGCLTWSKDKDRCRTIHGEDISELPLKL